MNTKNLDRVYQKFMNLLIYFLEDTYNDNFDLDFNDHRTIIRYISIFDTDLITDTLDDIDEVLKLEDFPDEWVSEVTNRYFETKEDYHNWVKWMRVALEEEAKRQGKYCELTDEQKKARRKERLSR